VKALYGIESMVISKPEEIAKGVDAMLKCDGPFVLEVMIPKEEDVLPMIPGGKTIKEMILAPGQVRQD
jgi:acetolactate synthase-1/2/3 large subunit